MLTLGDRVEFWALGNFLHLVHPLSHPGPRRKSEAPITVAVAPLIYTIQVICLPLPGAVSRREASEWGQKEPASSREGALQGLTVRNITRGWERKAHLSYPSTFSCLSPPLASI